MTSFDTPSDRDDTPRAPGLEPADPPAGGDGLAGRERRAATSDDPQAIREDIERTRREMAGTIDAVEERVSPARIVERRRSQLRRRLDALRANVMGVEGDVRSRGATDGPGADGPSSRSATDRAGDVAGEAADRVQAAPERARARTRGNPMAAGMIAFGLGALIGSALPSSDAEQELAERGARRVDVDRLKQEGQRLVQDVREPVEAEARRGADEVRSTARDEAGDLQDEARTSGERLRDDAQQARERVREEA